MKTRIQSLVTQVKEVSLLAVGVFLLGIAALVSSVGYSFTSYRQASDNGKLLAAVAEVQNEQYCRYRASLPVSEAEAAYFRALGAGLVAVANEDDVALEAAAARGSMVLSDLDRAIEARDHAVQDCVPKETPTP